MRAVRALRPRSARTRASVAAAVGALLLATAACGSGGGGGGGGGTAPSSSGGPGGSPIKIGNVGVYSGFASDIAIAGSKGLQAWADGINAAGGIAGHPVEIIVKDDGGKPAKALQNVKELVEKDHVVALVGNHESGVDAAWASYASQHDVPVLGGTATGVAYTKDPNFFPVTGTNDTGYGGYANAAVLFHKTVVSVAYCAEVPACAQAASLLDTHARRLGIRSVPGQAISASATSYAAQCQKLKDSGAEAVFAASDLATAKRLVEQCAQQDYRPIWIDNPQNWRDSELSAPVWEGLVFAAPEPLWFGDGPGTAEFLAAMTKYQPGVLLNTSTTSGWYAGKVLEKTLAGASGAITSQTIYDGLYKLGPRFDLDGVLAPVTYAKGKPAVQEACTWYAQVKSGKLTTPFGAGRVCGKNA